MNPHCFTKSASLDVRDDRFTVEIVEFEGFEEPSFQIQSTELKTDNIQFVEPMILIEMVYSFKHRSIEPD